MKTDASKSGHITKHTPNRYFNHIHILLAQHTGIHALLTGILDTTNKINVRYAALHCAAFRLPEPVLYPNRCCLVQVRLSEQALPQAPLLVVPQILPQAST